MKRALAAVIVGLGLIGGACGNGGESAAGDLPLLPGSVSSPGDERSEGLAASGAPVAPSVAGGAAAGDEPAIAPWRPVEYRLGSAVDALDGTAAAYRLEADVDEESVRRLAGAFGVEGRPVERGDGWNVGAAPADKPDGRTAQLYVAPDGSWSYSNEVATQSAGASVAVACAPDQKCDTPVAQPVPQPMPPADLPADGEAESEARRVLAAAGVEVKGLRVEISRSEYNVHVAFVSELRGMQVYGWSTAVSFGDKGVIQHANGSLARASRIGDYPLIGTKAAFDRFQEGDGTVGEGRDAPAIATGAPEPAIDSDAGGGSGGSAGGGAVVVDPPPPSPPVTLEPEVVELTDAEVVLMVDYPRCPGDSLYLVPMYRLSRGTEHELLVAAVDDKYLASSRTSSNAAEELEPCPGQSVPGREADPSPPVTG